MPRPLSEIASFDDNINPVKIQVVDDGSNKSVNDVSSTRKPIQIPDGRIGKSKSGVVGMPGDNRDTPQEVWTGDSVWSLPPDRNPSIVDKLGWWRRRIPVISNLQDSVRLLGDTLARYQLFKTDPIAALHVLGVDLTKSVLGMASDIIHNNQPSIANIFATSTGWSALCDSGYVPLPDKRMDLFTTYWSLNPDGTMSSESEVEHKLKEGAYGSPIKFLRSNGVTDNDIDLIRESLSKIYHGLENASYDQLQDIYKSLFADNPDPKDTGTKVNSDYRISSLNNSPYNYIQPAQEIDTIAKAKQFLDERKLLSGYKTIGGFEIGTNHQWRIRIRPYESGPHGELTCTPPLPAYILPDIWSGGDGKLRWFSYSEFTPVLSYDLNFGTFKHDQIKLFNGSMDMLLGWNQNIIMSVNILDDSYGSMTKYMATYINSVYDPVTNSAAPYYNMAFEIELTILRTGGQVNHMFKFIGIPVDYAPRFDGTQDANEVTVSITFGIIGYIAPHDYEKPSVPILTTLNNRDDVIGNTNARDWNFSTQAYRDSAIQSLVNPFDSMPLSDMKWGDIVINPGMYYPDSRARTAHSAHVDRTKSAVLGDTYYEHNTNK